VPLWDPTPDLAVVELFSQSECLKLKHQLPFVHFILIFKTTQHSGKEWGSLCSELAKWGWQPAESAEWLLQKKSCKLTECWHSFGGGITIYNLPRSSTVTGSFSASKLSWKSVMWECRVHKNKIPEYIHEYIHCLRSFMLSNAS
jgi:hypothetical protein